MAKLGMVMFEVGRQFRYPHRVGIRYDFDVVPPDIHIVIGNLLTDEGKSSHEGILVLVPMRSIERDESRRAA